MIVTFLRDLFCGCREASPDSRVPVDEVKNSSKRSDKYDSDVKALKERYRIEFETGVIAKPSQNIRFCGIFRVKIRVNQLIPSQEKSGVLKGVSVRVVALMFIIWLH